MCRRNLGTQPERWWRRSNCGGGRVTFDPQEKPRWKSSTIKLGCWWHLQKTKKIFMTVVPDRSAPTLMAAIETHVEPGTLLMTDCWKSYSILDVTEKFCGTEKIPAKSSKNCD